MTRNRVNKQCRDECHTDSCFMERETRVVVQTLGLEVELDLIDTHQNHLFKQDNDPTQLGLPDISFSITAFEPYPDLHSVLI